MKDSVVIMPEGSFINYITDRKGDNYYYNLSPLFYNDVFGEEKFFDANDIGFVEINKFVHGIINVFKTDAERSVGRRANDAAIEHGGFVSLFLDNAKTTNAGAWVDA